MGRTYHFSKGVVPKNSELGLWLLVAMDDDHSGERHDFDWDTQLTPYVQDRLEEKGELLLHHRLEEREEGGRELEGASCNAIRPSHRSVIPYFISTSILRALNFFQLLQRGTQEDVKLHPPVPTSSAHPCQPHPPG